MSSPAVFFDDLHQMGGITEAGLWSYSPKLGLFALFLGDSQGGQPKVGSMVSMPVMVSSTPSELIAR
jgi:hypothetical protein